MRFVRCGVFIAVDTVVTAVAVAAVSAVEIAAVEVSVGKRVDVNGCVVGVWMSCCVWVLLLYLGLCCVVAKVELTALDAEYC